MERDEYGMLDGCIPVHRRNRKHSVLDALEKYAEKAYDDVAKSSALYGEEICGHVYSPYFYRRYVSEQFERMIEICKKFHLTTEEVYEVLCGRCKIVMDSVAMGIDSRDVVTLVQDIAKNMVYDQGFDISIINCLYGEVRNAFVFYYVKKMGVDVNDIDSNALVVKLRQECDYVRCDNPGYPRLALKGVSGSVRAILKQLKNGNEEYEVPATKELTMYDVKEESYKRVEVPSVVVYDDRVYSLKRNNPSKPVRKVYNEIATLAALENKSDVVFGERSSFFPLEYFNRVFKNTFNSYHELLKWATDNERDFRIGVFNAFRSEEYSFRYVKAGVFYAMRNRIAFMNAEYDGCAGDEALVKAADDIMSIDSSIGLIEYIEKYFMGVDVPTTISHGVCAAKTGVFM